MFNKTTAWLKARYPLERLWRKNFTEYYLPKNLNFWYCFGVLALVVLAIQVISGIWLVLFYTPTPEQAFVSIETIMREVPYGWLFRYMHTTGASAFFIIIYLHIYRSLLYGSYKKPRELVWITGLILYLLLLIEAFCGYLLPWGQMSYWAAQVMTATLSALPWIGDKLMLLLRGDYLVSGVTLQRFFVLHIIVIPLFFLVLIKAHLTSLRHVGSSNPTGRDLIDKLPFHPYYTIKDAFAISIFLLIFSAVLFFAPMMGGYFLEPLNSIPADPLQTPHSITAAWYMAPFYGILRAVPDKLMGIIVAITALLMLFGLPWLERSAIKPLRQRSLLIKIIIALLIISFIALGYLGTQAITLGNLWLARLFTISYFAAFLSLPFGVRLEKKQRLTYDEPQR